MHVNPDSPPPTPTEPSPSQQWVQPRGQQDLARVAAAKTDRASGRGTIVAGTGFAAANDDRAVAVATVGTATVPAGGQTQAMLYHRLGQTLNLSLAGFDVHSYTSLYGTLSEQCPFGDRVWAGLRADFSCYRYAYQMHGCRRLDWFLCPRNFSRANAGRPVVPGDSVWYPAVFCDWGEQEHVQMACLQIVLVGCRPWRVHRSRLARSIEWD